SQVAVPGYNFNNTPYQALPLGNSSLVGSGLTGIQSLTNFATGRVSPNSSIGGFVFSASSNSFSLLVRALKTQGRIDILSRPQITTLDNQTATMLVGQRVPYISSTNVTSTGLVTNGITYQNVGVSLAVTPRIGPDGK